jgi:hypothetical protein
MFVEVHAIVHVWACACCSVRSCFDCHVHKWLVGQAIRIQDVLPAPLLVAHGRVSRHQGHQRTSRPAVATAPISTDPFNPYPPPKTTKASRPSSCTRGRSPTWSASAPSGRRSCDTSGARSCSAWCARGAQCVHAHIHTHSHTHTGMPARDTTTDTSGPAPRVSQLPGRPAGACSPCRVAAGGQAQHTVPKRHFFQPSQAPALEDGPLTDFKQRANTASSHLLADTTPHASRLGSS